MYKINDIHRIGEMKCILLLLYLFFPSFGISKNIPIFLKECIEGNKNENCQSHLRQELLAKILRREISIYMKFKKEHELIEYDVKII